MIKRFYNVLFLMFFLALASKAGATCTSGTDAYSQAVCALSPSQYFYLGDHVATTANQVSGGVTGSFTNSPPLAASAGIPGSGNQCATTLNGTNQLVTFSSPTADFFPNSTASAGWSVVAWVRPTSSSGQNFLGSGGAGSAHYVFILAAMGPATGWRYWLTQCNSLIYAAIGPTSTYTQNDWHLVAMTTLGAGGGTFTNMKAYADSSALGTTTSFSGSFCTDQIGGSDIGGLPDGANFFTGTVAQLAYFNTQLSAADISNLYSVGSSGVNTCLTLPAAKDWPLTVKRELSHTHLFGFIMPMDLQ